MFISVLGQSGLIYIAESLSQALVFIMILGLSWPGKRIIGLGYILDFYPEAYQNTKILWLNLFDYPSILLISICYQYINRSWYPQQLAGLILSMVCLVYCYLLIPESPKFMYNKTRFDETREIIEYVMRLNGDREKLTIVFDTEHDIRNRGNLFRVY